MSLWSRYSTPDSEWEEALKTRKSPFNLPHDIFTRRKLFDKVARKQIDAAGDASCKSLPLPSIPAVSQTTLIVKKISVKERKVNVFRPEGEIRIRIYVPDAKHAQETFPLLVNLHGMLGVPIRPYLEL